MRVGTRRATLAARYAGCSNNTRNNQLLPLYFTRLANATVDEPGVGTIHAASPTPIALPGHPTTLTLTVNRSSTTQPTTVELTVTDDCGHWPSLIGRGSGAF